MYKLKEKRLEKGLSCADMARVLGFKTAMAYWRKENGVTRLTVEEAKKLASFYNVSVSKLIG